MSTPTYCNEEAVYEVTGLSSQLVQDQSGKTASEVTTLVNDFILKAENKIQNVIGIPIRMRRELHLGDGEKSEFQLGCEDEEFFLYDVEDCVEKVHAVYFANNRKKLPFPKNCDDHTEATASSFAVSNCVASNEATIVKAGGNSVKLVFSAAGYARYPSAENLAKNIDIYEYVGFWFHSSNAGITFTLRLYDKDGNYNEQDFMVEKANIWYIIWIKIDSMDGSMDWETMKCYYWEIRANGACTAYIDNFAFNDGWIYTAPKGLLCIHVAPNSGESPPSEDYPYTVTYEYDPFKSVVPENIKEAAACIAGVKLIDYLRGIRYADTGFRVQGDTFEPVPDEERWALMGTRTKLSQRAQDCIAQFGYRGSEGVV